MGVDADQPPTDSLSETAQRHKAQGAELHACGITQIKQQKNTNIQAKLANKISLDEIISPHVEPFYKEIQKIYSIILVNIATLYH
jgi:hypothetical protein